MESKIKKADKSLRIKFGIDPTFDRLHLGHFVPLRVARFLQEQGHHLDLVFGTLTAQLGDPSGQDKTRPFISEDIVNKNTEKLIKQVSGVLLPNFLVHKNHNFVDNMSIQFFLSRLASKFTVANMLSRDGFRNRQENNQPISLHEFLVPLIQGWDSVVLKSNIEIGGSDQLFNFQVARVLQESEGQDPESCIMTPIISGTNGQKMSKSLNNAIWLNEKPEEMFGQIMSIPDKVVNEWIDLLTDLTDIPEHPMEKKKKLSWNLVCQLHDEQKANSSQKHFESLVQRQEIPNNIKNIEQDFLLKITAKIRNESNNKARKLIRNGGVSVNSKKILDPLFFPEKGDILKIGKRSFVKVV